MPVRPLLWVVGVLCLAVIIAPAFAADNQPSDPLIRVLQSKGILTQAEADTIGTVAPADQRVKLAQILRDKGLITSADFEAVSTAVPAYESGEATLQSASLVTRDSAQAKAPSAPKAPPVIPAVAPVRVLQLEPAKVGGLIPDIKLGSGAKMKIYGFFKSSVQYDTYLPTGNDAPLPGFSGDTGPDGSKEFHLKARASRIGANFEWPDIREGTSITARVEADWEGNFTRAFNRNISAIRSNQLNLRSAWARIDHMFSDQTSGFVLFGQDWTPFGSSILPNSLETTLLGVGFGSMYTRDMQVRVGFLHSFAGTSIKIGPEFAIVHPGFGDTPPFINTQTVTVPACAAVPCPATVVSVSTGPGNLGDQLAYAERQGADSARPEVEGRLVFQFQLDHAKGVAPAQIIISAMQGARTVILPLANIPSCTAPVGTVFAGTTTPLCSKGTAAPAVNTNLFKDAFPTGATVDTSRNGWTAGFQLPTRYVTFVTNYYRGTDLRFFFAGQLLKEFNNFTTPGITGTGAAGTANTIGCPTTPAGSPAPSYNCGFSIDGASTIAFAAIAPPAGSLPTAIPAVMAVPQGAVRSQGGFVELGFPLSRIFQADPTGRNAGWTLNLHYGLDSVNAKDARRGSGTAQKQSSWGFANLQYKLNQYVTFGYELGHYQTIDLGKTLFEGVNHHVVHDLHSEFATIFTF
ncbi:MAG: hypothetical protein LAN37_10475 [Acidobacteriia bacterium]|nr:hypothetical protein [Terriglobia bacterium]